MLLAPAVAVGFQESIEALLEGSTRWASRWVIGPIPAATYCKPLMGIAVADIDVGMVLTVIEPQWKVVPTTMDRVRSRIGEVLGWAQTRGLRPTPIYPPVRSRNGQN